jgi:hypothetical protein
MIRPAARYIPVDDLAIVTCYYNPERYETKRRNYNRFVSPIVDAGTGFVAIECQFGDTSFELSGKAGVHQVRGRDVMWQKERLLNLAIARLPDRYTKVAWLDCDVLFENDRWMVEASSLLEKCAVVQPFEQVVRLPLGHSYFRGLGDRWEGFAAVYQREPTQRLCGDFNRHGHTGFAWAARRDILARHGLFDICIAGSGDHLIIHGFCGDFDTPCTARLLRNNVPYREAFVRWASAVAADVNARIGYVPGSLLHLWHGDVSKRHYVARSKELEAFGFHPGHDIRIGSTGCWEWNSAKPALHTWAAAYFGRREEDGGTGWQDRCRMDRCDDEP